MLFFLLFFFFCSGLVEKQEDVTCVSLLCVFAALASKSCTILMLLCRLLLTIPTACNSKSRVFHSKAVTCLHVCACDCKV